MTRREFDSQLRELRTTLGKKIPGLSNMGAAWLTHKDRRRDVDETSKLTERLDEMLRVRLRRLGHETSITEERSVELLRTIDRDGNHRIMHCSGWQYYSRQHPARHRQLSYWLGKDDNGLFVRRVPGTVRNVAQAVDAVTPAEVRRALQGGRKVLRQGDVWVICLGKSASDNFDAIQYTHHVWDRDNRTLRHESDSPHTALHIPFAPAKAVLSVYDFTRMAAD